MSVLSNWRNRLIVLAGAVLVIGIGMGIRLAAEPADHDLISAPADKPAGPPQVTVSLADATLLPEDYPKGDVEMFGRLLNSWDEGYTRVLQYRDNFRLDFGKRRLSADSAVIWITPERLSGGGTLKRFVIYLDGNARVSELRGTTTSDARLIVSLETSGRVWTDADIRGSAEGADGMLYQRARSTREHTRAAPVADLIEQSAAPRPPTPAGPPPPPVTYRADSTGVLIRGSERIIVAQGSVYVAWADRSAPTKGKKFTEIRADRAVLFAPEQAGDESPAAEGSFSLPRFITGVYLEGDVILTQGERTIEGSRLFYDREHDRALILDAVMSMRHESRNVPIVVRADQIRQLNQTEFRMDNGEVTSSKMYTPQYALRAKEIYIEDKTERESPYASAKYNKVRYRARGETVEVRGVPIAYWPASQGTLGERDTALRTVRVGFDSDFGPSIESQWHLFRLLNLKEPEGYDVYLNANLYGKRGPAIGFEGEYTRDKFYGFFDVFGVLDRGSDELGDERTADEADQEKKKDEQSAGRLRGRILARHRHYLTNDWELTAELAYISDRSFLEEWYENEFDTGKEQETLVYLKKQWDNKALTGLVKLRINPFLNQTEKFPEVKYYQIGQPLLNNRLVYFTENSVAALNYAVDEDRLDRDDSGVGLRIDTRHEFQMPLQVGPVHFVPYLTMRGTAWTNGGFDRPNDNEPLSSQSRYASSGGSKARLFVAGGFHSSVMFSRVFNNVESRFWDVHRLRHLIKPEINVHLAASSIDREELAPFDPGNESIHGASAINFSLRQRLQTKRGGPGAWRNVDWMTLDLEATAFANTPERTNFEPEFTRPPRSRQYVNEDVLAYGEYFESRPENSLAKSTFNWFYQWRISDTMTLLADGNAGDRFNFGLSVQRSPRWSMYFGDRRIASLESNELIFQSHYKINRKYDMLFNYSFDTIQGETASISLTLIRKFQRWYAALTFDLSNTKDRELVMLTLWPEGAPEIRLGRRNYSDYGSSTTSRYPF